MNACSVRNLERNFVDVPVNRSATPRLADVRVVLDYAVAALGREACNRWASLCWQDRFAAGCRVQHGEDPERVAREFVG